VAGATDSLQTHSLHERNDRLLRDQCETIHFSCDTVVCGPAVTNGGLAGHCGSSILPVCLTVCYLTLFRNLSGGFTGSFVSPTYWLSGFLCFIRKLSAATRSPSNARCISPAFPLGNALFQLTPLIVGIPEQESRSFWSTRCVSGISYGASACLSCFIQTEPLSGSSSEAPRFLRIHVIRRPTRSLQPRCRPVPMNSLESIASNIRDSLPAMPLYIPSILLLRG